MRHKSILIKNTSLIFLGTIITKIFSLIILPLYSNQISPSEYGKIDVYITIVSILYVLMSFQSIESSFRFVQDSEDHSYRSKMFSNAAFISLIGALIFSLCVVILDYFLNIEYLYFLASYVLSSIFSQLVLHTIRGINHTALYSFLSTFSILLSLLSNYILISWYQSGGVALLFSPIIGNIAILIVFFSINKFRNLFNIKQININTIREQLSFSIPLIPNAISIWLLASMGRFILLITGSIDQVGILSFAMKFPLLFESVISSFSMAWQITSIASSKESNRTVLYKSVFENLVFFLCFMTISLLPMIKIYMSNFINIQYAYAIVLVPVLVYSFVFKALTRFNYATFYENKKTNYILLSTTTAVVSYFILGLILTYLFGMIGIAYAYLVTELVQFIISHLLMKRYVNLSISLSTAIQLLIVMTFSFSTYYLLDSISLTVLFAFLGISLLAVFNIGYIKSVFTAFRKTIKK